MLAAATLGPACVENVVMSLLGTKESLADPVLRAEFDAGCGDLQKPGSGGKEVAYSPGMPGTEDGECFARHYQNKPGFAAATSVKKGLMVSTLQMHPPPHTTLSLSCMRLTLSLSCMRLSLSCTHLSLSCTHLSLEASCLMPI